MNSWEDFLDIYERMANQQVYQEEIDWLYKSMQSIVKGTSVENSFVDDGASRLDKIIAIDDVAHRFHSKEPELLNQVYPDAEQHLIAKKLDELAGLEQQNDVRKYNRGFFTTLASDDGLFLLYKQVGKTNMDDIKEELDSYENMFNAQLNSDDDIISNAELLTLYRARKDPKYKKLMKKRGITEDTEPMIVGGYASVEDVDREGHLITIEALKKAFKRFLKSFRTRNINVGHSDAQVGWPLPAFISKQGHVFKSGVDDKGLYLISELRDDVDVAKKVKEAIESGELKSYSVAGSATKKNVVTKGNRTFLQVDDMQMLEVTICLPGDEKVWTRRGLIPIKDVKEGDLVLTHKNNWKPVIKTMKRWVSEDLVKVYTKEGSLTATKEHPIMVHTNEWVSIKDFEVNDALTVPAQLGYQRMVIQKIESVPFSGYVYNLEIADDNSYVTEVAAVHNCEKPVNQDSNFDILKSYSSGKVSGDLITKEQAMGVFPDEDIELSDYTVCLVGGIVKNEETQNDVDVLIRSDKDSYLSRAIHLRLSRELSPEMRKRVSFIFEGEGPHGDYVPLYQLKLSPVNKNSVSLSRLALKKSISIDDREYSEKDMAEAAMISEANSINLMKQVAERTSNEELKSYLQDSISNLLDNMMSLERRFGNPKTDEERRETHKGRYGNRNLPPRGSGLNEFNDYLSRRRGKPKTDKERKEEHKKKYGTKRIPPRGKRLREKLRSKLGEDIYEQEPRQLKMSSGG